MAVNDVLQVKFASWMAGQLGLNVRYYKITAQTFIDPDLVELATALQTSFKALYQAVECNDGDFLGVSVKRVFPGAVTLAGVSIGGAALGTAGPSALPTQTCGIITLRSAFAGRTNRGRAYIPFPSESDNDPNGEPSAGYVTRLQDLADGFALNLIYALTATTVTLRPVICQPNGILTVPIVSALARPAWATQRRRGLLGAHNPRAIPL